jgi:hypothetical protein
MIFISALTGSHYFIKGGAGVKGGKLLFQIWSQSDVKN